MVGVIKQDEQSATDMQEVVINFEKVRRQATISSDDSRNYIEIDRNGSLIYLSGDESGSPRRPSPQYRNGRR